MKLSRWVLKLCDEEEKPDKRFFIHPWKKYLLESSLVLDQQLRATACVFLVLDTVLQ